MTDNHSTDNAESEPSSVAANISVSELAARRLGGSPEAAPEEVSPEEPSVESEEEVEEVVEEKQEDVIKIIEEDKKDVWNFSDEELKSAIADAITDVLRDQLKVDAGDIVKNRIDLAKGKVF